MQCRPSNMLHSLCNRSFRSPTLTIENLRTLPCLAQGYDLYCVQVAAIDFTVHFPGESFALAYLGAHRKLRTKATVNAEVSANGGGKEGRGTKTSTKVSCRRDSYSTVHNTHTHTSRA